MTITIDLSVISATIPPVNDPGISRLAQALSANRRGGTSITGQAQ
jgi:hypothetical protein